MNKNYILYFLLILFFSSCGSNTVYRIEGKLTNLEDPLVYVVYESSGENVIDSVICPSLGRFIITLDREGFNSATLYFDDRQVYTTVYLEPNKTVSITGDVKYPNLIQVKGGRINDKLSDFRKRFSSLFKERDELDALLNHQTLLSGDTNYSSRLINVNHQIEEAVLSYICDNPDEEASVVLINKYFVIPDDVRKMDEMLAVLSPNLKDFYLFRELQEYSTRANRTALGAKAPDFNVKNLHNKSVSLDSLRSRYKLIAFTAPWCDMCQIDVLYLDKIAIKYNKEQLEIVLVSLDDKPAEVREVMKTDSIEWNLVSDSANQAIALLDLYNVSALPRCFLLDKENKIILKTESGEEIKHTLESLIER
jgi:Peroxiredoxin